MSLSDDAAASVQRLANRFKIHNRTPIAHYVTRTDRGLLDNKKQQARNKLIIKYHVPLRAMFCWCAQHLGHTHRRAAAAPGRRLPRTASALQPKDLASGTCSLAIDSTSWPRSTTRTFTPFSVNGEATPDAARLAVALAICRGRRWCVTCTKAR